MINDLEIYQIFQNRPRIVIFLDNARAHISDFAQDIAEALNIYYYTYQIILHGLIHLKVFGTSTKNILKVY